MISSCRGRRASNSSTGHFSRASGSSVWLVYARVRTVRSHASSHPSSARSSRMRINSATAIAGWVSLSWTATLSGSAGQSFPRRRNRETMSASEQATRKYSWTNRSERPRGVESSGYRTRLTVSASDPVRHRAEEVAAAELAEVEDVRGRGLPQAEGVDRPPAVTDHRPVVGHPEQVRRLPAMHRDLPRVRPRTGSRAARTPSRSGARPPTGRAGPASGRGVRPGSRRGSPGGRSRNRSGGRIRWPGWPSWPASR